MVTEDTDPSPDANDRMTAIVRSEYGGPDVLRLETVDRPTPAHDEVLIAVDTAATNAADWHILRGKPFPARLMDGGLRRPTHSILGSDVAGRVEAVGSDVDRFQPGDAVFGDLSGAGWGGFAEYVSAPRDAVVSKPADVSFEAAAAAPLAGVTAMQALREHGDVRSGDSVLINGASGGVGTFAVQIARALGAEVTAVCSTRNVETARSIDANHVIDYTREDFADREDHFDLIVAVNGSRSIFAYRRALRSDGTYVMVGGSTKQMIQAMALGPVLSAVGSQNLGNMLMEPDRDDLTDLRDLLEGGAVEPVIDRRYPLAEVPDALASLEDGHAWGKVVVTVAGEE
jgi:NADPH:quinone reductase-like Zn-dependent oxidoreductase